MRRVCRKSDGFTLIEVMLAVMILAFSATAAIKLVVYAQNGLRAVKQKRVLYDEALRIQTEIRTDDEAPLEGKSGDISWTTENKSGNYFGSDFGLLDFNNSASKDVEEKNLSWRKLSVKNLDDEIILCIPIDSGGLSESYPASSDAASSDKRK